SYFITFTGNPQWPEIKEYTEGKPGETRSDLKCRIFLTKAQAFLDDLLKHDHFGKVQAYHVVMEFQKRGMPHLHILLIMENEITVENVDNYISARIPEQPAKDDDSPGALQQREYYDMVMKHMLHICHKNSACQVNGRCTKGFKKPFSCTTVIHSHKPPDYQRLKPQSAADKNSCETENSAEKDKSFDEPMEDDGWEDDTIFKTASFEKDIKVKIEKEDESEKVEEATVEVEEEELPFFDELRKDFDEELSFVQYKRLEPAP
uniref:Helitron helicase-like domain-containing protein n=1 Tax=Panagrolaimus sp. ES5 TaxID=591445 RepID=A0AC34GIH7_9BILA